VKFIGRSDGIDTTVNASRIDADGRRMHKALKRRKGTKRGRG
jgi:hypothetical protein